MKVVSISYYLPSTKLFSNVGTVALRSKSGLIDKGNGMSWNSTEDWTKEFEVVKTVKFYPNTVFAFAPCKSSWHGFQEIPKKVVRDTLEGHVIMRSDVHNLEGQGDIGRTPKNYLLKGLCLSPSAIILDRKNDTQIEGRQYDNPWILDAIHEEKLAEKSDKSLVASARGRRAEDKLKVGSAKNYQMFDTWQEKLSYSSLNFANMLSSSKVKLPSRP
mmetsp:Transcript_35678/g.49533  ORF Transcript_35678/g.49533 Transcript_35678/m.49533 type:complete len:216 (+) Transcript_35678:361-1008(+)